MIGKIGEEAEETIPPEDAAGRDGTGRGPSALRGETGRSQRCPETGRDKGRAGGGGWESSHFSQNKTFFETERPYPNFFL